MNRKLLWAAFCACALLFHFKNLGSTPLWQDEAETAVLARHTLRFGVPKVFDGVNYVSQNMGLDHDARGIWNYSPWLGIYLTAASFALFGESTFTARLPFAVASLLTLFLVYETARRWSKDRRVPILAVWLTLFSIPYLLHARQCRYYVLDALFSFYLFYAYESFLKSRRGAGANLVLSSLALFHSNFLVFFAVAGGIALHFAAFVSGRSRLLRRNAAALLLLAILLLASCAYFHVWARAAGDDGRWLARRVENAGYYWVETDLYLFPALLIPALLLDREALRSLSLPLVYLLGGLAILCLAPHHFFRYLVPFIPLCAFFIAQAFCSLFDRNRFAAFGMLAVLFFTHALSPSAWIKGRWRKTDLIDFVFEITHPLREPISAASAFLNQNAEPGQTLLVSFPDLPFMFYTPLRVIGGRSGAHRIRPAEISWLLFRNASERSGSPLDLKPYKKIALDAPNWPWGNRPDPDLHVYRTVETGEAASIYRRL